MVCVLRIAHIPKVQQSMKYPCIHISHHEGIRVVVVVVVVVVCLLGVTFHYKIITYTSTQNL